jgi:pyruvate dehydrogenase E2 component (dihydrolipoamide acetyltransferase)
MLLNPTRKTLAEKMLASATQIPQFTVSVDMIADQLSAYKMCRKEQGNDISLTAILIYSTARTIQNHPLINSSYDSAGVLVFETVNMAVAVAAPQGLVAPVIYGAEKLELATISEQLDQLVQTARNGRLSLDQVQNATFTISNLGMHGVHQFAPLVNPPQAAILGVGGIRPAIVPSASGVRPVQLINLTVSADHRVLDGVSVAQFLAELRENLEGFN